MIAKTCLLIMLTLILFAGCSQTLTNGYYWGNYSRTNYAYIKNPTPDTLEAHIETLQNIVSVSNKRNLRIPPGVLVELAMLSRIQDSNVDISNYLNQEAVIYPEANAFIEFVKTNLFLWIESGEEEDGKE